ncbi:aldehyde dehydrogenase family protein [Xanthomonas citri]|uniref:aldehyde dehydrogenase family protein n=2 Tax=Xanthomonas citri TaxID=346 RepID=UPI003CCFC7BC
MRSSHPPALSAVDVPASQGLPSGLLIGSIALLILGVQPILLGTLVEQKLITLSGVGIVAMREIVALGLGVALGDALLPHRWQRQVAVLAALLAALLDLATTQAVGDTAFVLVRAAAGLAEGLLLWVATLTIVRAAKPDRVTAVFMLTQAVAQIALANLLAWWVLPSTGWKGGFAALGAVTLCAALLTPLLPATLSAVSAIAPASRVRWSPTTLLPLLIAFVQMAATGALWAYLEPLGLRAGLDAGAVQAHTSLVLAMQIVGALAAIWWVRRLGHARTLVAGSLVLPVVTFDHLDTVLAGLDAAAKPLALYLWSNDAAQVARVLARSSSGSVVVNHCLQQFMHTGLPFGGIGQSGIGSAHGVHGFKAFSHERAVLRGGRLLTARAFFPPYREWQQRVATALTAWLARR